MSKLYLNRNLQFIFGVTLMAVLGVSSIFPALPDAMRALEMSPTDIGMIISVFTLPGVIFSPIVGVLADRIGRKAILVPALVVFALAGFACYFATSVETLLALRFVQGMGAAPLGVLYGILIGDLFEGQDRAAAMGMNAAVLSVGTALFPAVGGWLAHFHWQTPFILPLLALPVAAAIACCMKVPHVKSKDSLNTYFRDAFTLMKGRSMLALFATTFITFIILYGPIVTYLPLLMDERFGASPKMIGTIFLVSSGMTALASFKLGWLSARFGNLALLGTGAICYGGAMLLMPSAPGLWEVIPPVILFGVAQGLNLPTVMTMLAGAAPARQRGAIMAMNGMLLRLSQTVAPLIMGGVYAAFGIDGVYYGGVACALMLLLLSFSSSKTVAHPNANSDSSR